MKVQPSRLSTHVGRKKDDKVERRDVDCSWVAAIVSRVGVVKGNDEL